MHSICMDFTKDLGSFPKARYQLVTWNLALENFPKQGTS